MTAEQCRRALSYAVTHKEARDEIRGGIMPKMVEIILREPRDREGFKNAINKVADSYRALDPQRATDQDRKDVFSLFGRQINEYIEITYGTEG